MSDVTVVTARARARRSNIRKPKTNLPSIVIDGETWDPQKNFAATIGVCSKTVERMNLRSVLIGGVRYVNVTEGLREIAARARRRNAAPVRRRGS
jgi:hypothetical protein